MTLSIACYLPTLWRWLRHDLAPASVQLRTTAARLPLSGFRMLDSDSSDQQCSI